MGLLPTRANENHRCHPRASGGPCLEELDSRLRRNDQSGRDFQESRRRPEHSEGGISHCFENPCQDPSPFHPTPSSLSLREREEGKGSWGEGLFSWFLGARQPTGVSDFSEIGCHSDRSEESRTGLFAAVCLTQSEILRCAQDDSEGNDSLGMVIRQTPAGRSGTPPALSRAGAGQVRGPLHFSLFFSSTRFRVISISPHGPLAFNWIVSPETVPSCSMVLS